MKQVLQNMSNGQSTIISAPAPVLDDHSVLIATSLTLISAGTERMLIDFGKASFLGKAKQQPEKVKMVLEKIKTDGLLTTIEAVQSKLSQPLLLGYCNVGTVLEVGKAVKGFLPGDRVVSNGGHADIVKVPENLCAKVPDSVDDESAVFTILASIALQGIRLANPTLGENFVVIGVGLIGLLSIQLLKANGCNVLAIDLDETKLTLAKELGAETCNPAKEENALFAGLGFSQGYGVDGVIITASTESDEPVHQAAQMCRKRGRIVLVGVTGLKLNRADFYEKELSFQVSCSYGPGRYDSGYEEKGLDYPIGFVRWTEQRNFEAILGQMACKHLNLKPLISNRYPFENAVEAYAELSQNKSVLGILLQYTSEIKERAIQTLSLQQKKVEFDSDKPVLGMIGAGNYASRVLIPALQNSGAQLHTLATSGGINSAIHGKKMGFAVATTDLSILFESKLINTIAIATRHNSHAELVVRGLNSEKHIFVEKPLALNNKELQKIQLAYETAQRKTQGLHLMIGFNRRFSPQVQKMKSLLSPIKEPKSFIMTVNAGAIPSNHWTQDLSVGGGRIIGEACHFIDLARFLVGHKIVSVQASCMGRHPLIDIPEDKATIILNFEDGSFGSIHYFANGASTFPKERIEVFTGGRILQLDNFRKLKGYGWPKFNAMNLWKQDKGHRQCILSFLAAVEHGLDTPIPVEEVFEVARVSVQVADLLKKQEERMEAKSRDRDIFSQFDKEALITNE